MTANRKETVASPFLHAPMSKSYGADSYHQHQLVIRAVEVYMKDPFERSSDLRGHVFEVTVHDDGLFVTIEDVSKEE